MKSGAMIKVGSLPSYKLDLQTYDPDKLGLGPVMIQQAGAGDNAFAGPMPVGVVRPMEMSIPNAFCLPSAMQYTSSATSEIDFDFYADNSAAGATRKVLLCRLDRKTGIRNVEGFITLTFPGTSEAKTIRSMEVFLRRRTTGTVAVSGTGVTGTSTIFNTEAVVGSRIGFGSTASENITQWYEISAVASDTALTLSTNGPTLSAGTPYVIEDLRIAMTVTSVTNTNGGLYLVKGLRRELFSSMGTTISAATTVDQQRAVYWLADAGTSTNLTPLGSDAEPEVNSATRNLWVIDSTANPVLFKYNIYAPLASISAGRTTSAFILKTGSGGTLTGTPSQLGNLCFANTGHGPGAGLNCLYFTTGTRIYRTSDVGSIISGSTTWLADNMVEIPAGGTNTFAATGTLTTLAYSTVADRFMVLSNGTNGSRSYFTQYNTSSAQMDRMIFIENRQFDQSSADSMTSANPAQVGAGFGVSCAKGMFYLARNSTSASNAQIYNVAGGADWEYTNTSQNRIIFPRISTPDAAQYLNAYANETMVFGGASGRNLGLSPEPYRLFYRTVGITDNSGGWNAIPNSGDLSGVAGAAYIQFMAEFRVMPSFVPARIQTVGILYENTATDSHFYSSASKSDAVNKRFAWLFASAFGTAVPPLRVRLFDAVSGATLVDDNTNTPVGLFEKSTDDGATWTAFNITDRTNGTTYFRYTPSSLADNVKVRQSLSLL